MSGLITESRRADLVVGDLAEAGIDALLVNDLVNVRYLTGYTGSNGLALVGPALRVFITDFRYVEQAAEEVDASFERVRAPQDLLDFVGEVLSGDDPIRLGFDDAHTSVRAHARLREKLPERIELIPAAEIVERRRRVKSADEIERIHAASRIADAALETLLAGGLVGRTERELALALERGMQELGAESPSFEPIVAAGPHGALPHAQPRDVKVERGQLVVIDWGARLAGYCSDCTRTVATGELDGEARDVYELVQHAQLTGLEAVRAGAAGVEVDAEVRELIAAAGHGERYGHGLGHGVGLEVHEAPRLSQRSEDTLEAGNVVTVEPGVYLTGRFGVRIEDLVVVAEDGCEILTGLDKGLRVVD